MCAGAAAIGRPLVTCGDCGGPGCCSSRSAGRGSGSGSPAFKGDAAAAAAAAARGDGGQVEGTAQTHTIHGPSGLEGLVSWSPAIRGWIRHHVPSNPRKHPLLHSAPHCLSQPPCPLGTLQTQPGQTLLPPPPPLPPGTEKPRATAPSCWELFLVATEAFHH